MSASAQTTAARVMDIRAEGKDILALELGRVDGLPWGAYEPGAHLDLHLPNGMVRSYSLCGLVAMGACPERYRIAVGKSAASRGGSAYVHERLRVGDVLPVSAPRNHFALDDSTAPVVLVAGGIGITPLLAMARQCAALGRDWTLHYCVRTPAHAAFLDELWALPGALDRVLVWQSAGRGRRFDAATVLRGAGSSAPLGVPATALAGLAPDSHVYCCGSPSLMAAVESAIAWLPDSQRHFERFVAAASAETEHEATLGFIVHLAQSKKQVHVPAGRSVLECLESEGVSVPFACREGLCGSCETAVLDGDVDHRDCVLSQADRAANQKMMVCVSRAARGHLTLNL